MVSSSGTTWSASSVSLRDAMATLSSLTAVKTRQEDSLWYVLALCFQKKHDNCSVRVSILSLSFLHLFPDGNKLVKFPGSTGNSLNACAMPEIFTHLNNANA